VTQLALVGTIFALVCGSSAVIPLLVWGRPARWGFLFFLVAAAAAYAVSRPDRPRLTPLPFVLTGAPSGWSSRRRR
jgi:hypothetical protein